MRGRPRRRLLVLGLALACVAPGVASGANAHPAATEPATSPPPGSSLPLLRLVRVPGTFLKATHLTAAPGARRRLFILQQTGAIRVVRDGRPLATPFLDLTRFVTTARLEQGLLSMVFAPDYATSGKFYVFFTGKDGNDRLVEYRRSTPDRANPRGRLVLFVKKDRSNHHGGLLLFGPDRLLYVAVGDDGHVNDINGQLLNVIKGKILRIDPRPLPGRRAYRIPPSNPFVGRPGVRPEIYAYGLRNPWRFTIDPPTGAMVIGDAGEGGEEEINYQPRGQAAGRNYGWPRFEGTDERDPTVKAPGAVPPVFSYVNQKGCSVLVGGFIVRDASLGDYNGRYLYGDYCRGFINSIKLGPGSATSDAPAVARQLPGLASFGQDAAGHIYAVQQNGSVYRLVR